MVAQFFVYSGLHYKTCPIELREVLAKIYDIQIINDIITQKIPHKKIEFVPVSTCNRFDIFFFGKMSKIEVMQIYFELCRLARSENSSINFDEIEKYLRVECDENALRMLFKIGASLDSLVIGESQILGQLKDAFLESMKFNFAHTLAVPVFNKCMQVAKKIRSETEIGKNSVSIGSAAVDLISRIFENLNHKKILIIGTGEMGKITAQHILTKNVNEIFVSSRTFSNAEKLAFELGKAWPLELNTAVSRISEFDICIVAASGNKFIINNSDLKDYSKKRQGKLSIFIDLSVPRKVEPSLSEIENLFLFNIDDIEIVIEQNRRNRQAAAVLAEKIIEDQVHEYMVLHKQKENMVKVGRFHSWVKNIVNDEIDRYISHEKNGKKINQTIVADAVAKKIVAHAAFLARNHMKSENDEKSVGELLNFLFNLSQTSLLVENEIVEEDSASNVVRFPNRSEMR